ncbi:hypothetical protein, partial [Listeria monocytogenes]|uniref:hypothetical protein n=1 Tax=Listeria monocytogenes TaxID=1639 RepID=UPI0019D0B494
MTYQLTFILWQYLKMASENVENSNGAHATVDSPHINNRDNVQQEGDNPHATNNTDQMMNDGRFRS